MKILKVFCDSKIADPVDLCSGLILEHLVLLVLEVALHLELNYAARKVKYGSYGEMALLVIV